MLFNAATYSNKKTVMHRVDARVKIVLLIAYSITLFCVHSWIGMAICTLAFAACAVLSKLPVGACFKQLFPLWVILAFALLSNSLALDVGNVATPTGLGAVSAGAFGDMQPVTIVGSFGFVPQGFARGCFYVLRIWLLAFASLVLTTTTSADDVARSLEQFLLPLAKVGVPAHDAATIVSIALRFIPVTFDEVQMIRAAQQSRGAAFEAGSLLERMRAWMAVFIPLFVSLFRRADHLAMAMDVRCYGMAKATSLRDSRFGLGSATVLVLGLAACLLVANVF